MEAKSKVRRRHSAEFKTQVLSACAAAGASVAGVALAHGLNANLVRQWQRGRGFKLASAALAVPAAGVHQFVPLALPAVKPETTSAAGEIRVQVRRGGLEVSVSWPQSAAADCAGWLGQLLR